MEVFSRFQNTAGELGRSPSLALYTEGIIKFSKLRLGDLKRGEKSLQPWLPMMLKKKIFNTFSQSTGGNNKVVTPELKDRWANCKLFHHQQLFQPLIISRAVCHVMVLCLILNNFKLDASLLTESIRVRPDHLKKLVSGDGAPLTS